MSLRSVLVSGLLLLAGVWGARFFTRKRIRDLERQRAAQHASSHQLIASQENERKRIAAEIHDSLGQNLLLIRNVALFGHTHAADSNAAAERFEEVSQLTAAAIQEVRNISYALRPIELDRLGLTKAIAAVVGKVSETSAAKVEASLDPIDNLLFGDEEIAFYRIVQEGLNNAIKHSGAKWILVQVQKEAQAISLRIQDDGRGFSISSHADEAPAGLGLKGISERARILNGDLKIESMTGRGTMILLTIPLAKTATE